MKLQAFDLTGKSALVTGSGQGIGLAIATALAQAGASIVLNGRDAGKLDRVAKPLREAGHTVGIAAFDVTDRAAVIAAVAALEVRAPVDILVNNAGIQRRAPLQDFEEATWHEIVRANLDSVFFVGQAVARHMIPRRAGKIINVTSVQAELGRQTIAPYSATKGAVKMLTRGMCADWARFNIQVNGIGPGYFATPLNQALVDDPAFSDWLCQRTPAGRWGQVEELGGVAVLLASAASDFMNGQIIYVDGGLTAVV